MEVSLLRFSFRELVLEKSLRLFSLITQPKASFLKGKGSDI